jgi:hypothetical protein
MCDRLCTLVENQSHCVKNYKFLILSIIEHVFTQVVPVPKPRAVELSEEDQERSLRASRRAETRQEEAKARAAEKQKKIDAAKEAKLGKTRKGTVAAAAGGGGDSVEKKDGGNADKEKDTDGAAAAVAPAGKFFGGVKVQPDFEYGKRCQAEATQEPCMWNAPITYELQVEMMLCLQRITEHFAAAALSIQQSRSFDGVWPASWLRAAWPRSRMP